MRELDTDAQGEGYAAHYVGTPYQECPYLKGTAERSEWEWGWLAADIDAIQQHYEC